MKTAEEWDKIFWSFFREDMASHAIEHFIQEIQADALRHAAGIVNETRIPSLVSMIKAEAQKLDPK